MTLELRYVDPARPPGRIVRANAALAATRLARLISRRVSGKLDPFLLRVTRGRLATTLVFPTAVLETCGARSGARRRNAVIYFHDGTRAGDGRPGLTMRFSLRRRCRCGWPIPRTRG